MDAKSRFSIGHICDNMSLDYSIYALTASWITQFWTPDSIRGDDALNHKQFREFCQSFGSQFEPVPPRRHQKNVLESKNGIIRSVYIRLREDAPQTDSRIHVAQAIDSSNQLYGSDIMSAYEISHAFCKPVYNDIKILPEDVISAQQTLESKRKIAKILRSKSPGHQPLAIGDLIEVFVTSGKEKSGKWTSPRTAISLDTKSGSVSVPGSNGKIVKAAIEDIRPAIDNDLFADLVREANDKLDEDIDFMVNQDIDNTSSFDENNVDGHITHEWFEPTYHDDNINTSANNESPLLQANEYNTKEVHNAQTGNDETLRAEPNPQPDVGEQVEIFWPLDNCFYPGIIAEEQNDNKTVLYEDGGIETFDFSNETWRYASSAKLCALSAFSLQLQSTMQPVLKMMMEHFGNKSFMRHQAQAFPQFCLAAAYKIEQDDFLKTVKQVPLCKVPSTANIISSHVLYKIKMNEDLLLKLKARIAPHGNEDCMKDMLRSDCSVCPPAGFCITSSIASLWRWRLTKIDVKTAFLQTGSADRDAFVVPPYESDDRGKHLWLLLTASYGLVNANAKWQVISDQILVDMGVKTFHSMPQLFMMKTGSYLTAVLAKIVDDKLLCGSSNLVDTIIDMLSDKFTLGTSTHGPGPLRYYGLNILQHDDYSVTIDGNDKLDALETHPITRTCRRELDYPLNSVKAKTFASINSSIGWLEITASPSCSLFVSMLQQIASTATIADLRRQATGLKEQSGQLCHIAGLLIGPLQANSIFHIISWSSHKAPRAVKSIGAAETLAAGEAIDVGKNLVKTYERLMEISLDLIIVVDSKDLFTTLSTQRQSTDKSIRGDIAVIRFEFEINAVSRIVWVSGKLNFADIRTKFDSPLNDAVLHLLQSSTLPFDFKNC